MSRPVALLLGLALLAASAAPAAEAPDWSKIEIRSTHVAGSVWMLEGAGGNIAASIGEDGVVLVDDEFAPLAAKIQAALKSARVTDRPVRFVINTHYHFDHSGGNGPFADAGATVLAHDNVRARLLTGTVGGNGGTVHIETAAAPRGALPVLTFDHQATVHLNGEDVRALHYPAGHTDGDAIIFFPTANVVHMGDIYVRYGFPFIDVAAGGSIDGMIAACEDVLAKLPADVRIIPGHGGLSNVAELREFTTMLKETRAAVAGAIRAGRTLEEIKSAGVLAPWSQRWSGDFISTDAYAETLWASLHGAKDAPFVPHN
jgi:glyoxylase-like metal-dependent hydrolase (beta-lactamase superfamily II)